MESSAPTAGEETSPPSPWLTVRHRHACGWLATAARMVALLNRWQIPCAGLGRRLAWARGVRFDVPLALVVTLHLSAGCYTTSATGGKQALRLGAGGSAREILLPNGSLTGIRVRPSSWIRLSLRDGSATRWFEARNVRVAEGMLLGHGCAARRGIECERTVMVASRDIAKIEINDFDMGDTLIGIAAGTSVVVAAAAVEACLLVALEAVTGGRLNSDLGITRAAIEAAVKPAGRRPAETPWEEQPDTAPPDPELVAHARPLFSRQAERRDWVRLMLSSEAGFDDARPSPSAGVVATLRLWNVLELGGGLRFAGQATSELENGRLVRPIPFLRYGLHLDLDARRQVAIPLLVDHGWADGGSCVRLTFGVRVRLTERFSLGIFPFNPVWSPAPDPSSTNRRLSHVTGLEAAWTL